MRVPRHIVESRHERLRGLIRTDGFLPVGEICRRLGVSEATARRDLSALNALRKALACASRSDG